MSLTTERRERARRARAPARLPDRRGRRVPRARLRRRRAPEPLEPRARRHGAARHDLEDVLPGRAARLGGRPAEIAAQLVNAKQNTDQCAGALGQRLFEEYVRRGWIDEQLAASRALYRRKSERMLTALERSMPAESALDATARRVLLVADAPRRRRDRPREARSRARRRIVPGTPFFPDGRGGATCGSRSAWSTRRRSTTASSALASLVSA